MPIAPAVRRVVTVGLALACVAMGSAACGGGDTQGRQDPDLREVESQVAQLRLEVQSLRQELRTLRESVPTTTTLPTSATTVTTVTR